MNFLFVHQNFPAQFRHVVDLLVKDSRNNVVALADDKNVSSGKYFGSRLKVFTYTFSRDKSSHTHPYLRGFEEQVRRGQSLFRAAAQLKKLGFNPDVVVVHPGWGEALFLRELFPVAKHIHYCEYFFQTEGGDFGFDPEFPNSLEGRAQLPFRNSSQLVGLTQCDIGISPTLWQRSRYPIEYHSKIEVIHEGVDTQLLQPDPCTFIKAGDFCFKLGDEVVTFIARNLEPYRGFHTFMRSIPALQALRPNAHILIVGGEGVSYGRHLPEGESYRKKYSSEIEQEVNWSQVHFLGKLPYETYIKVLQVSAAHIYLTYPFVLSWSMLEAMSCGCIVIGSNTAPVREMIVDGHNGVLVDFFDERLLAETVSKVLETPQSFESMRLKAREFVVNNFDLHSQCLPTWMKLLTSVSKI